MCDVTARYALIGQPCADGCRAAKLLRVAAFAPATCTSVAPDYNLRVYCVDDTIDAVQVCSTPHSTPRCDLQVTCLMFNNNNPRDFQTSR